MHYPVHIRFSGMEPSSVLIAAAKTHACGLTWARSKIIECWVGIQHHPEQRPSERPFSVRVDVLIPGHELSTQRIHYTDVQLALGHAFEDMGQRLDFVDAKIAEAECAVTINGQIDILGIDISTNYFPEATQTVATRK